MAEHQSAEERARESAEWTTRLRQSGQLKQSQAVWIDANDEPHITQAHKIPSWAWPIFVLGGAMAASALLGGAGAAAAGSGGATFGTGAATVGGPAGLGWTMGLGAGAFPPAVGLVGGAAAGAAAGTAGGAAGGAASGAGRSVVNKVLETAAGAIPAAIGAIGAANAQDKTSSPEIQAMLDQQRQRLEASNPLYEAVLRLAHGRLPTHAQAGQSIPSYADVEARIPQVEESDAYTEDPATRRLLRAQQVRSQMSDPLYQSILRLAQGRMPNVR